MEQRLVREKRAEDWTPTAATRKAQLWESLDPVFYSAVKVRYPRLQDLAHVSLAELSDLVSSIYVSWEQYAGGTPGTAAAVGVLGDEKPDRDDILGRLLAKLEKIRRISSRRKGLEMFQAAADGGATAFAAAAEQHVAPAVVSAGAASGGVDISAYGFATLALGASGDDEMDVHEELRDLRHQIGEAISMGQVSCWIYP
ncbi:hypothetical protein CYMTET_52978 [Cymbomonas tetramitiformis]|uniref:Uncharacterized protein n=1 Tax=Cymbomonas tetramitiformis TaxID=36881 RepID=A0AAE0BJ17_9CHLO|nr:hypothetical protein CYMTET_52978 [Cymbomonas tetramitiformis]